MKADVAVLILLCAGLAWCDQPVIEILLTVLGVI